MTTNASTRTVLVDFQKLNAAINSIDVTPSADLLAMTDAALQARAFCNSDRIPLNRFIEFAEKAFGPCHKFTVNVVLRLHGVQLIA